VIFQARSGLGQADFLSLALNIYLYVVTIYIFRRLNCEIVALCGVGIV